MDSPPNSLSSSANYRIASRKRQRKTIGYGNKIPLHPSVAFKKLKTSSDIYSVRAGIGWRAVGVMEDGNTMAWFWNGSPAEYDKLLKNG